MQKIGQSYKAHFRDKSFLLSFVSSVVILLGALSVNFYAAMYAVEKASNPVTDIVLSNIRVYDVDTIFIYGPLVLWIFAGCILLIEPRRIPFTLKSIALFVVIRSIFISLTHIGSFPTHLTIPPASFINDFTSTEDLFFSAHTGLPFLLALIFWEHKYLRTLFIGASLLFGTIVLLGHLHYSIDVLSAFFITYTIYHIAERVFPKDKRVFTEGIQGY